MPFKILFAVLCLTAAVAFSQAATAETVPPAEPGEALASSPTDSPGEPGYRGASDPDDSAAEPGTGESSDPADPSAEPGSRGASDREGEPEGLKPNRLGF
ncbi:MAG: hypothetical protein LBQ79_10255 [Deltaproteobacteria bacterium]|jgi:hypothetical protein|nr:hypothetical protein [Deltaproteobacteria bacterium]